jgi:hypothetical protein
MKRRQAVAIAVSLTAATALFGQSQKFYTGTNVTGQLILTGTVNLLQTAQRARLALPLGSASAVSGLDLGWSAAASAGSSAGQGGGKEAATVLPKRLHPPLLGTQPAAHSVYGQPLGAVSGAISSDVDSPAGHTPAEMLSAALNPAAGGLGFNGLSHFDQRNANSGNQFSVEPPSPGIAVGNGFVLEGVNNAVQVYNTAGSPLLPAAVSSNQLFGLPPAIDRSTGVNGPYPTDMRVFYDPDINRFFVLQWAQSNDAAGNPLGASTEWLAVSQTPDPTAGYNIYTMDTTDLPNLGCPCVPDFPQIGADRYGFYISSNEFNAFGQTFNNANILALSKASLASGAAAPTAYRFYLPMATGYEFAIQPATTPPGGAYFLANGGLEYFVSTRANFAQDNNMAVWAMYNTSSIGTTNPNLLLTRVDVGTLTYSFPDVATQRPGPLPYGSKLFPPNGFLTYIDGGDTRILSLSYASGRLYATLATQVTDTNNRSLVGGAYVVFSPVFRGGALAAPVFRQGFLVATNNHLLRPAIAVNAQGRGAIAFTLVGPDYFPSAAFIPIDSSATPSALQVVALGTAPEDGFSGYQFGVARWGDNSAAVVSSDGTIWMAMENIPNTPRTDFANWGTFLMPYKP